MRRADVPAGEMMRRSQEVERRTERYGTAVDPNSTEMPRIVVGTDDGPTSAARIRKDFDSILAQHHRAQLDAPPHSRVGPSADFVPQLTEHVRAELEAAERNAERVAYQRTHDPGGTEPDYVRRVQTRSPGKDPRGIPRDIAAEFALASRSPSPPNRPREWSPTRAAMDATQREWRGNNMPAEGAFSQRSSLNAADALRRLD